VLEFAESELLEQDLPRRQLASIAASGVKLSLDDFGIGNTSLARLQAMALHQIKIDRSLLPADTDDGLDDLTKLIMSVSQFLRLETVAKNVETEEHAAWARHAGMTLAQGIFFGPPVPVEELATSLTHVAGVAPHG
jgi:EAL domain-containing protein (putative c-di-GMP-specific phosphodiesterase class I)